MRRRDWWDDQLDEWSEECCRRAEEQYEPPVMRAVRRDERELWPRVDTVFDEQAEDRAIRGGAL